MNGAALEFGQRTRTCGPPNPPSSSSPLRSDTLPTHHRRCCARPASAWEHGEVTSGRQAQDLLDLLRQTCSIGDGDTGALTHYRHEIAPPIPGGAAGVPEVVERLLTVTDGAALFCSDDPELEEIGAPPYEAVLYDRSEIEDFTNDFRGQLLDQIEDWRADGDLTERQSSTFSHAANQFRVIGATVTGDSFIVEAHMSTSIRIWPHETLLAPFVDPDEAPSVHGLVGLIAWLEARLR